MEQGLRDGAPVLTGGSPLRGEGFDGGYYYPPTVVTEVASDSELALEEVFGAILAVIPVADFEEAIDVVNETATGSPPRFSEPGDPAISEAPSEKSMELVARSLREAVWIGNSLSARSDMLLASTMAACAFNSTRLGLAHALAMPLGAKVKPSHGDVVSILLPEVMTFNVVGNQEKFANIVQIFGEPVERLSLRAAADAGVAAGSAARTSPRAGRWTPAARQRPTPTPRSTVRYCRSAVPRATASP